MPSQSHSFACSSPVLRSSTSFSYLDWGDWYTGHDAWTHCSRFGLPKCGGTNECHRLRNLNWLKRDIHYVKNEILFWLRVRATKSRRQEKWWRDEKRNQTCTCMCVIWCNMYPFLDLGSENVWVSEGGIYSYLVEPEAALGLEPRDPSGLRPDLRFREVPWDAPLPRSFTDRLPKSRSLLRKRVQFLPPRTTSWRTQRHS